MDPIIKIRGLRKQYREFILSDIDLDIPMGGITGIIGPNGAGKTTTIKLILNLIRPDRGSVEIFGRPNDQDEISVKNRIGYVGEDQPFYDFHSAAWTGRFVSHFFQNWNQDTFDDYLEVFDLPPRKRIKKYSKGMRVKLALAIALSHNPELIILDEPTAGLDPVVRREVLDHLQDIATEQGRSVLISSHITDDLQRIADTLVYMVDGKIALLSDKDTLMSNWKRIHFKPGSLDGEIVSGLFSTENQMFGSTGVTREYQRLKSQLERPLAEGTVQVENVGLDDILIQLAREK